MTNQSGGVRVRYAPSPTGDLHIGGLRTALFNWLFARHHHGTFLIRVEDTDLERSRAEYTDAILASLAWCGLNADEPIVYQSARFAEYHAVAERLLASGAAYRCYCTQDEVRARVRNVSGAGDEYFFYDGRCRDLGSVLDKPSVIRVRVPRGQVPGDRVSVEVHDLIHGLLVFPLAPIDDFVIVRSNGAPMYNFTVVVDDVSMGMTHIIRGDDHIINTPRQVLLYEAAGFLLPRFAHVPLILGADGKKLSKRDAATAVTDYRTQGILPDALCNYLVRLGWAYGNREVIGREELVALFSLEQVGVKAALFDPEKLLWMNSVYLRNAPVETIVDEIRALSQDFRMTVSGWSDLQCVHGVRLYRDRVKTLVELARALMLLSQDPSLDHEVALTAMQSQALLQLIGDLKRIAVWEHAALKQAITLCAEAHSLKFSELAMPIRLALTGTNSAPGVVDLLELLGPSVAIRRLSNLKVLLLT